VPLEREDLRADPLDQFAAWFADAEAAGQPEPEAAAVATSDIQGRPSVRFVLIRGVDHRGFVFYTNANSRKAQQIASTGRAALAFRWDATNRQVRVEGRTGAVAGDESDAYFASRARGSQLGAWASAQSEPAAGREELDRRLEEVTARFEGRPVPRPPWWGGFRVAPDEMEFWQQGAFRLHDRFRYRRDGAGAWVVERLFP
jgi:pyridoxamine 5'-phosphate oxidase